jgi:hypothetical protein
LCGNKVGKKRIGFKELEQVVVVNVARSGVSEEKKSKRSRVVHN